MYRKLSALTLLAILALWIAACAPAATNPAVQPANTATVSVAAPSTPATNPVTETPVAASTQPSNTVTGTVAAPSSPSTQANVTINNFAFDPPTLTVKVGSIVQWTNQQDTDHTVTSDTGEWDSGHLSQGQSFQQTFAKSGTFPYHCSIHSTMKGTIVVTN